MSPKATSANRKVKVKKKIRNAYVHVHSTFNNTQITFADPNGDVISWSSAGVMGFKGTKKSTPYAAQLTAADAAGKAKEHGVASVKVFVRGPGSGRESALRAIQASGIRIEIIRDVSPIPHNGCRPPKMRRV